MKLPLFPLHAVLFPGAALPLRVFEPRYREMMADLIREEEPPDPAFGVVCIRKGYEVGDPAETHDVGCLAAIETLTKNPDGTFDMIVRGTQRFRVTDRPPDDPYPRAEVSVLKEVVGRAPERALQIARVALERYIEVAARSAGREPPEMTLPTDPLEASYAASAVLAVDLPVVQELLEAKTAVERLAEVAKIARSEAHLLETVGPPVPRPPIDGSSLN